MHRIFNKAIVVSKEKKSKQAEKLEGFISYIWKSRYLFMRQVICQANIRVQLAYHIYFTKVASFFPDGWIHFLLGEGR